MKKNYVAPKMDVVELKKENMILTSGACPRDKVPECDGWIK